jgi:Transposase DDE domain group 1
MTECIPPLFTFQDLGPREVVAAFNGGKVTSDGGALLLREVEAKFHFIEQFARCFSDHRDPEAIEHSVADLLKQRVFGLCLGYEDLNDHDRLRYDPLLAVLVGKKDPQGNDRLRTRDKGKALAGKSTLNRLELTPVRANASSRYKKIVGHLDTMQHFFVEAFVQQYVVPPADIVLDVDTTDARLHGHQLGRFFHGYYDEYCYLPLYIFCGDHPLLALLRPANIDASVGLLKHLERIVARLREVWPAVRILVRGDSGFCREHLMRWCEGAGVDFLFGMAKNKRLQRILGGEMHQAKRLFEATGQAARVFKDFSYRTHKSWSRERRVVGKAEHLSQGANPRFVVTSLPAEASAAQPLYEEKYCARGDMENRIKETKLCLFADRVSCATMRANQIRLCLSTVAYILMRALRAYGLKDTELAQAQCDTIRVKLLKIGGVITTSVRRVVLALSEAFPFRGVFARVCQALRELPMVLSGPAASVAVATPGSVGCNSG